MYPNRACVVPVRVIRIGLLGAAWGLAANATAEPDTALAPRAHGYRYAYEEPSAGGPMNVCRGRGIVAIHPDYPNQLVICDFSVTGPPGVPPADPEAAERFLSGFRLLRCDLALEPSARFAGKLHALAAGSGALWLLRTPESEDADAVELVRLDPVSLAETGRVSLDGPLGSAPTDMKVAEDGVWIAGGASGVVAQVDPARLRVARTIRCGDSAGRLAVLDASTGGVAGTQVRVDREPRGLAWGPCFGLTRPPSRSARRLTSRGFP